MENIVYRKSYIPSALLDEIKNFYKVLNDDLTNGPRDVTKHNSSRLRKEGCWDVSLRLEIPKNPVNKLIQMLKKDFGEFIIHTSSVRYLGYPFSPHSDIRSSEWLIENRKKYDTGYTFLIPLGWKEGYKPGTAFFSSPPADDEPMYIERQDVLPEFQDEIFARNFSVKKIIPWQHAGDLVAWKNYIYHCSMTDRDFQYSDTEHCKEFISIETFSPKP